MLQVQPPQFKGLMNNSSRWVFCYGVLILYLSLKKGGVLLCINNGAMKKVQIVESCANLQIFIINCHGKICMLVLVQKKSNSDMIVLHWTSQLLWQHRLSQEQQNAYYQSEHFSICYFLSLYKQGINYNFLLLVTCISFL